MKVAQIRMEKIFNMICAVQTVMIKKNKTTTHPSHKREKKATFACSLIVSMVTCLSCSQQRGLSVPHSLPF